MGKQKIIYHGPGAGIRFAEHLSKVFLSVPILTVSKDTDLDQVRSFASNILVPSFVPNAWIGIGPLDSLSIASQDALLKGTEESQHNLCYWCESISSVSKPLLSRLHNKWCYSIHIHPKKVIDSNILESIRGKELFKVVALLQDPAVTASDILKTLAVEIMTDSSFIDLWYQLLHISNLEGISEGLRKKQLIKTLLTYTGES